MPLSYLSGDVVFLLFVVCVGRMDGVVCEEMGRGTWDCCCSLDLGECGLTSYFDWGITRRPTQVKYLCHNGGE